MFCSVNRDVQYFEGTFIQVTFAVIDQLSFTELWAIEECAIKTLLNHSDSMVFY